MSGAAAPRAPASTRPDGGASADAPRSAPRSTPERNPIFFDVSPPDTGARPLASRRRAAVEPLPVVLVLVRPNDEDFLLETLRLGLPSCVVRRADPERIVEAIRAAADGGAPQVKPTDLASLAPEEAEDAPRLEVLTPRELDVLRGVAGGNTNRQIGGRLGLSVRTVEHHRANLAGKLGIRNRAGLVSFALANRLL